MNMLLCYLIAAGVVLLDQLTKWLVVRYLEPIGTVPLIENALHFTYVENTGAAFGMMKDSRWIFMVVSSVAIVVLIVLIAKYASESRFASISVAMILGGGIGNMIDRVRIGYVVDFIDFRLIDFAVFNVADSFVTVGACLLILHLILELVHEGRAQNAAKAAAADRSGDTDGAADEKKPENDND